METCDFKVVELLAIDVIKSYLALGLWTRRLGAHVGYWTCCLWPSSISELSDQGPYGFNPSIFMGPLEKLSRVSMFGNSASVLECEHAVGDKLSHLDPFHMEL